MKPYKIVLLAALALVSCKKEEETTPQKFISKSVPVTPGLYASINGSWMYEVAPSYCNCQGKTKINLINDTLLYLYQSPSAIPPSDTFRYELREYAAYNSIYTWHRTDSINQHFDQLFYIEYGVFYLGGLKMVKK